MGYLVLGLAMHTRGKFSRL